MSLPAHPRLELGEIRHRVNRIRADVAELYRIGDVRPYAFTRAQQLKVEIDNDLIAIEQAVGAIEITTSSWLRVIEEAKNRLEVLKL